MLIIVIKGVLLMKHVPLMSPSLVPVLVPAKANTFPLPDAFFGFSHLVLICPSSLQLKKITSLCLQSGAKCLVFPQRYHLCALTLHTLLLWPGFLHLKHTIPAGASPPLVL